MYSAYEKCISCSSQWQSELENQLAKQESNDIIVSYKDVAKAFPSTMPNPYSFNDPLIDHDLLIPWAKERVWDVKPAPECAEEGSKKTPPVRFTKIT